AGGHVTSFTPTALSFVSIPGFANHVAVRGNVAYVAAGSAGLQIVDVTNRSAPSVVASVPLPKNASGNSIGNGNRVKVFGNRLYFAAGSAGLQIFDLTNPISPSLLGSVVTPDASRAVDGSGTL